MKSRLFFPTLLVVFSNVVSLPAQTDPVKRLSMDLMQTKNFEIAVERSEEHPRPTAKEIGVLVERLCMQLDKIFVKYAPHNVVKVADDQKQAENEGKKSSASKKKEKEDDFEAAADRVIPKCKIFIFNDRKMVDEKCEFDGVKTVGEHYAGFFTLKTNSIYMIRSRSLQQTRQIILHETTHYYSFNFLPGGWVAYPTWFHEALATNYENHTWNGEKLIIGTSPRVQIFDKPGSALTGLVRFKKYSETESMGSPQAVGAEENVSTDKGASKSKGGAGKKTTPIRPELIEPFLNTRFTPDAFNKESIPFQSEGEPISHQYAMYQAFGRFLLFARPDVLDAILRQVALWADAKTKNPPRKDWFIEAWKKVMEEKPVSIDEIGTWTRKNQLPFKWVFNDWQDIGDQIAGKAEEGKITILLLRDPNVLPRFTVYPKNFAKFKAGVVINFLDRDNYGVVAVDQDGDVILMEQRRGEWTIGKKIGKTTSAPNRSGPYPNGPAFLFAVSQQGGMLSVQINKNPVGTIPKIPNTNCGFFLSSTEAIFIP